MLMIKSARKYASTRGIWHRKHTLMQGKGPLLQTPATGQNNPREKSLGLPAVPGACFASQKSSTRPSYCVVGSVLSIECSF
jgi:hypothetical protein